MTSESLIWISAPHFTAGLIMIDDRVRVAAPILAYMRPWGAKRILRYCKTQGWKVHTTLIAKQADLFGS
jgi:hypothetical protein